MVRELFDFVQSLGAVIAAALHVRPDLLQQVARYPAGDLLITAMTVLAGGTLLAGQSVILFANRVKPSRFVFSLGFYGVIFALGLALWATTTWLCARLLFGTTQPVATALRIAGLSCAPLLFGFFIAIPYLGTPIEWGLRLWSFQIMLKLVQTSFAYHIWQALICVALGWLLLQALTRLLGQPLTQMRDWLWYVSTGTSFDTHTQEVAAATEELRQQLLQRGSPAAGGEG